MRRFERRLRRRTERRMARMSSPNAVRESAALAAASAFGLALGVAVVLASSEYLRQPAPAPRVVAVSVDGLLAVAGSDDRQSGTPPAPSPPRPGAIDEAPTEGAATEAPVSETVVAVDPETEGSPIGSDAATQDAPAKPAGEIVELPPPAAEMPSVEQGPPAAGDVAGPPKQTRVAGLPIPPKPQWLRNAIRTPGAAASPMIAVIMDDVGVNQRRTRQAVRLPGPLTIAFIPYGFDLKRHVADARRAGHEIMVHVPMEPLDPGADPGPNALLTSLTAEEILRRLRWDLERFDGYVGISNHMGSRFTVWEEGMRLVMGEVRRRGLLFVDSWTHNSSLGMPLSRRYRVPNAARDVFIDHDIAEPAIRRRLATLEKIAARRGYAVGIAHPYALSMRILEEWIGSVRARGYRLVPISAVVRHRLERR